MSIAASHLPRSMEASVISSPSGAAAQRSRGSAPPKYFSTIAVVREVRGWQRMQELGGTVTLRHVAQQPRKVLEAAGIGRMMTIE